MSYHRMNEIASAYWNGELTQTEFTFRVIAAIHDADTADLIALAECLVSYVPDSMRKKR